MCTKRQSGVTLIELIVAMLIISVALVGVYSVLNATLMRSTDPLVRKQMFSIAEGLMEEILLKEFEGQVNNDCTPTTTPSCQLNSLTDRPNYNDVSDYNGFTMSGIYALDGSAISGLSGYEAAISVVSTGATIGGLSGADKVKKITVTVTEGPESFVLEAYRLNFGG